MNFLSEFLHSFSTPAAMVIFCTIGVLAVCCLLVKLNKLEKNIPLLGILFGLVAIATDACSAYFFHNDANTIISIVNAPSIVASFCFNPIAGLLAGSIATIGHIVILLICDMIDFWYIFLDASTIFVVTLYAAALRHWIFDDRQPLIITAGLAGLFGEILRLGLLALLSPYVLPGTTATERFNETMSFLQSYFPVEKIAEYNMDGHGSLCAEDVYQIKNAIEVFNSFTIHNYSISTSLEILFAHLPYLLWGMIFAMVVCSVITFPYGKKDEDFYSIRLPALLAFAFFSVLFGAITIFSLNDAYAHTCKALIESNQQLAKGLNTRIGYMMTTNSNSMAREPDFQDITKLDTKKLKEYARCFNLDEISVFDSEGNLVVTSIPEHLQPDVRKITDISFWRKYKNLQLSELNNGMTEILVERDVNDKYIDKSYNGSAKSYGFVHTTTDGKKWTVVVLYSASHLESECIPFFESLLKRARFHQSGQILAIRVTRDADNRLDARVQDPVFRFPQMTGKNAREVGFTEEILKYENNDSGKLFEVSICDIWHIANIFESIPINGNPNDCLKIYFAIPYSEYYYGAARQISVSGLVLLIFCIAFNIAKIKFTKKQKEIDKLRSQDMKTAFTIQDAEMQNNWVGPDYPCSIISSISPAREVGGDFYDYYTLPDGRIAITIADVAGKGVPAAFFMMRAKYILKSCMMDSTDLAGAVIRATQLLCDHNDAQMFVTAWIGILNPQTGDMEYVSAGHNPPLVKRADGSVQWIKGTLRKKPPLATFRQVKYQVENITLSKRDMIFLYTDGVTEAMNTKGELFGEERLKSALQNATGNASEENSLNEQIEKEISKFIGKAAQTDDITMLTMEIKK